MKDCRYYCREYLLEGMCKKYSNWQDAMPHIIYCFGNNGCKDYVSNKKHKPEQLPGQLDLFDIIDNKTELLEENNND